MKKLLIVFIFFFSCITFNQTATQYFNSGLEKNRNRDYSGAIADFSKAIELDPNFDAAYYYRGRSK